jgi:hypothetical protein
MDEQVERCELHRGIGMFLSSTYYVHISEMPVTFINGFLYSNIFLRGKTFFFTVTFNFPNQILNTPHSRVFPKYRVLPCKKLVLGFLYNFFKLMCLKGFITIIHFLIWIVDIFTVFGCKV